MVSDMERRLLPVKLDSYQPLREVVCETLREAIISGVLRPGERLMEIQLAEELGVSRTPVREAIRKLELEGFVIMIPRRGTYVADLSIKDINEVFEVRSALDSLANGLAAERITEEELEQMERLKRAFDPQALLNPGKVIPAPNRCGDMGMMKALGGGNAALSRA